ncbi:Ras-specific guanine nucleotide-releasing factor 2 [Trichoplax sp. H2]|nr:Ras-specific guanine nucleotide-releasing factor 2 [Trichoplax sp. H2]|eukprot:RDD45239.1 Ras-specific guanine nucleotide-releasing factor 2 [Trichoplax sp. H2]
MLFPPSLRVNEAQLNWLSANARTQSTTSGRLHRKVTTDQVTGKSKWQTRWYVLYQNILFSYESENSNKASGIILLENSCCEPVLCVPRNKDNEKQFLLIKDFNDCSGPLNIVNAN